MVVASLLPSQPANAEGIDVALRTNVVEQDTFRLDCDAGVGADIEIDPDVDWGSPEVEVTDEAGLNTRMTLSFDPEFVFRLHGEIDGAVTCSAQLTLFDLPLISLPVIGDTVFSHAIDGTVTFSLSASGNVPFDTAVTLRPHLKVFTQGLQIDETEFDLDVDVDAATDLGVSYQLEVSPALHYRAEFEFFKYDVASFDAWIAPYVRAKVVGRGTPCVGFYTGVRWAVLVEVLDSYAGRYEADGDAVIERKVDDLGNCNPEPVTNRMIRSDRKVDYVDSFGVRHWVQPDAVGCLGGEDAVAVVDLAVIDALPESPAIADCVITPNIGRLIRDKVDGRVDYIDAQGVRHLVPSAAAVGCLGDGRPIVDLDATVIASIPASPVAANCVSTTFTGRLIKHPGGRIDYVDTNGMRHEVPTAAVVACLGDQRGIVLLGQAEIDAISASPDPANCVSTRYIGRMVRDPINDVYFVNPRGVRYWVPNAAVVNCLGGPASFIQVDKPTLDAMSYVEVAADCSISSADDQILDIVVIGDSYAAGTGAAPYYDDTPQRITGRSDLNHAGIFRDLVRANDSATVTRLTNLAWHGGTLLPDGTPTDAHLIANQLRGGMVVDADVVFVNAGGNDAKFSTLVENCLVVVTADMKSCRDSIAYAEAALPQIETALDSMLRKVRATVDPGTTIVLVGYPLLERDARYSFYGCQTPFVVTIELPNTTSPCGTWQTVDQLDIGAKVRALGARADALQAQVVSKLGDPHTVFASVQSAFAGHEPSALGQGSGSWAHGLFDWWAFGFNVKNLYHPNEAGYAAIGRQLFADTRIPRTDTTVAGWAVPRPVAAP